eukprot:CAMPEP_0170617616 /NCGR_PEP_ID=MMETSP0224-20130122/26516_1 /TAXON_ID=285029 /ORGANISM="Togula jolla, Strain CCCM 725" /LENGTH=215 /DNA_ID=CAMNT_0010943527 /DNA_START=57 /DNA_END=704 /DNA_ORIENTATION=-
MRGCVEQLAAVPRIRRKEAHSQFLASRSENSSLNEQLFGSFAVCPSEPTKQPVACSFQTFSLPSTTTSVSDITTRPVELTRDVYPIFELPRKEQPSESDATGCPSESTDAAASLQTTQSMTPSLYFEIEVEKTPEEKRIGLEIDSRLRSEVRILRIKEGIIADYNKLAAAEGKTEVKPGDYIVEINGISGSRDVVMLAARESRLKIKLLSCDSER